MALFELLRQTSSKLFGDSSNDAPSVGRLSSDHGNLVGADRDLIRNRQFCLLLTGMRGASSDEAMHIARKALEESMALVPAGETQIVCHAAMASEAGFCLAPADVQPMTVESLYLDRFTVTNDDYARFLADGGYRDMDLWPADILPHLLQFVDETGCPGPQFWSGGEAPRGKANHPVVGISWYEAQAYAKWAGKRLPTASEWQRAGTWPSASSGCEQSYPWGNAFDHHRTNTWVGGIRDTVAVDEYFEGCTPNGIYQLVGNVWEWVDTGFDVGASGEGVRILLDADMAEIRGGAFNTYFDTQVTCQFRTGQPLLYRGLNVGFRCCISENDLALVSDLNV